MSEDQTKLEAISKIHAGAKLVDLVTELGVPYPKLLKWRKELKEAEETGTVSSLIDIEAVVVQEIADTIQQELLDIAPDEAEAIEGEVTSTVKGISGLQLLDKQIQTTAITLTRRIGELVDGRELDSREILVLTEALTKVQTAFFNKPGISVHLLGGGENHPLGEFKNLLSS